MEKLMKMTVKVLKVCIALAILVAASSYPAAWLLASQATEVQQIQSYDPPLIELNKWEHSEGDWDGDIVSIYGAAKGDPVAVLFVDESQLLRPSEDTSLALLPAAEGEHFLQVKTVFFFAQRLTLAAVAAVGLGLAALWLVRNKLRRSQKKSTASA